MLRIPFNSWLVAVVRSALRGLTCGVAFGAAGLTSWSDMGSSFDFGFMIADCGFLIAELVGISNPKSAFRNPQSHQLQLITKSTKLNGGSGPMYLNVIRLFISASSAWISASNGLVQPPPVATP
jgi:hypothetical protein